MLISSGIRTTIHIQRENYWFQYLCAASGPFYGKYPPRKEFYTVSSPIALRKVLIGIVLGVAWICIFLFIKPNLIIDWLGTGAVVTPLKPLLIVIGLLVLFFFHQFYPSSPETTKLSWTAVFTIAWLALIIFFPFRGNENGGAVGFFALIGGLAVCILWIRFFSDEIVA
jgi:hypothetical protein